MQMLDIGTILCKNGSVKIHFDYRSTEQPVINSSILFTLL